MGQKFQKSFHNFQILVFVIILCSCSSTYSRKIKKKSSSANVYQIYPISYAKQVYRIDDTGDSDESVSEEGSILKSGPINTEGCGYGVKEAFADFEICGMYHTCKWKESGGIVRLDHYCPEGVSFDHVSRECSTIPCSDVAPYWPVPAEWPQCHRQGLKRAKPGFCNWYFTCWWTGSYFTYTEHKCGKKGQYSVFDELSQNCGGNLDGVCPQEWIPAPPDVTCDDLKFYQDPSDCTKWYRCRKRFSQIDLKKRFYILQKQCPTGQIFDPTKVDKLTQNLEPPPCKPGVCTPDYQKLPPGYACDGPNSLHVHPSDCKRYYQCLKCPGDDPVPGWCYDGFLTCPRDTFFDDVKKQCVKAKICPQDMKELPANWTCNADGEKNPHPDDCSQYYTCIQCSKPRGWCYESHKCNPGFMYDKLLRKCVQAETCPQTWKPIPPEPGWSCEAQGEKNQMPNNCSQYYKCIACERPEKWCYTAHSCPEGQTFDDDLQECVRGRCPQWPEVLPKNWTCGAENDLGGDPNDCTKFYRCVKCPDHGVNPWCYYPDKCKDGEYFDKRVKKCVEREKCPDDDKEIPPDWSCGYEGDLHVYPDNCQKYYECYKCTQPRGWCYEENTCGPGETFDDVLDVCVKGTCPQDRPVLPEGPGWFCSKEGEMHVLPGNCSSWYVCEACSKPGGWCYQSHSCPTGQTYDEIKKHCVHGRCPQDPPPIPENWNCTKNGETHQIPEDCNKFYECVWVEELKYYTWITHQCPADKFYDEITRTCVDPPCPQLLTEIGEPPEWNCKQHGDLHVWPSDCTKYFTCLRCSKPRGWCYLHPGSCKGGLYFDQLQQMCVEGPCPQDRPEITENMTCTIDLELNVWETDCRKYYTCHRCDKPKGWCYTETTCSGGQTFDDTLKKCVDGRCPQLPPLIPEKWTCNKSGERHAVPEDCTKFYTCIQCEDNKWCYNGVESCATDMVFDDEEQMCVRGRCPQFPEVVPPTWPECTIEGDTWQHPDNCSMFYKCMKCPDLDTWCMSLHHCKDGETFGNVNKRCVKDRCRQWPPKLPQGFNCTVDGEFEVDPGDCAKYYKCLIDCPDNDWCYEPLKCPQGQTFDRLKKHCVEGKCPQDLPELPDGPGWTCGAEDDLHVLPSDCSSFYVCKRCAKPKEWCYERKNCPSGQTFYEKTLECIDGRCPQYPPKTPEGWVCKEENELNVSPEDCGYYYKCLKCPDGGWCYELMGCKEGENFDDKEKKCKKGKCPQRKPRPPWGTPPRCLFMNDHTTNNDYWPLEGDCYGYKYCIYAFISSTWYKQWCAGGSYFDVEARRCLAGECPYDMSKMMRRAAGGHMWRKTKKSKGKKHKGSSKRLPVRTPVESGKVPGGESPRSNWQVQTFVLGK